MGKSNKVAIAYDFDGTLAPGNMQEPHFLKDIGISPQAFWAEVESLTQQTKADQVLIYMYLMLEKAKKTGVAVRQSDFVNKGKGIKLFPGVRNWFKRLNSYAQQCGLELEHYLISSGNAEIFAGTAIYQEFTEIFASKFLFDTNGDAIWPAQAVNYTTKTQYLFRINKGVHDLSDNKKINAYTPKEDRAIPFEQMIYIGDGETDIPCFRLVREQGGLSVAVYQSDSLKAKEKALTYLQQGRVEAVKPADYCAGRGLDQLIKARLDYIAASLRLRQNYH